MNSENPKWLFTNGSNLVIGKGVPQDIPLGLSMLHKAAEMDHHDSQLALFIWYSGKDGKKSEYWFRRSELTKPAAPPQPRQVGGSGCAVAVFILMTTVFMALI